MSFVATLYQTPDAVVPALTFAQVVSSMLGLALLAAFGMVFRPLLTGIARALVLVVRPAMSKAERAARRELAMLHRMN